MPKLFIIANWKMEVGAREGAKIAVALSKKRWVNKKIVLCPSFTGLAAVREKIGSNGTLALGAQNVAVKKKGALTGEVSAAMLREAGCAYVIIGHSERRKYFGESDEDVNKKIRLAMENGLIPVVCLGEDFAAKKAGRARAVIKKQLRQALRGVRPGSGDLILIAYEPIWSISTSRQGAAETPKDAEHQLAFIKSLLVERYNRSVLVKNFSFIYGGSVSAKNASAFAREQNIEGLLVGGQSQSLPKFLSLLKNL